MGSGGCFWNFWDGSFPILACISRTKKATDLELVSNKRSFSLDHFSSLIFEDSLKSYALSKIVVTMMEKR